MAISPRSSPHHDSQVSGRPCTPTRQGSTSTTHNQHHGHSTPSRQTADCLDPLAGIANSPRKGPKEQSDQHSPKANRTPKGKEGTFPSLSIPVEATFFHNNGNKSRTRTNSGRTNQQHTETLPQSESHVDEQALFQFIQELGLDRNASSVSTDTGSSTDQHIENLQPTSLPVGGSGVSYPPANGYQELRPELTYSALSQGQSQSPVDRLQSATQINQASSCVPADLSQLPVRHQQPDNRSNGQVNQSHIRPSAENDVWWWHTVQPGQQHFVDNIASQPNEHDRTPFVDHEHNVYNDYSAFPSGAYNSAPFGFTFHNDDEEQAALQCFQILERLTPQQAVRVLNCVAHLFESEHNQYAPHDEAPQQSRQSSRTIYATMPAPAHQSVSQDARAVVHHGAGDTDAAHGRDPRSRRAPSPQRSSHAQGTRTPPRGTEYSALGSSSDAVGRSSATAAFSTPRVTLFRPPPPITTPINGTGDGKRPADRRALSECPTDSHLTDSRSATPASASTAATSVVTRAKSTSEDPDTSSSFDGLKTVSPTHQWCGVLTETEIGELQKRFGHIVLCPGFTTGFAKVIDTSQRVIIPGSTQGFKVTIKRMERYQEKASDFRFSWWPQTLSDLNMEEILIGDVLKGLDQDRWEQYRQAYKTQVARRSSLAKSPSVKKRSSDEYEAASSASTKVPKRRKSDATLPANAPKSGTASPKKIGEKIKGAKARQKDGEGGCAGLQAENGSHGVPQE